MRKTARPDTATGRHALAPDAEVAAPPSPGENNFDDDVAKTYGLNEFRNSCYLNLLEHWF